MATFAQLKLAVGNMIGWTSESGTYPSSADETDVERWLNEAVRDFLLRTRVYVTKDTLTLTAGEPEYRLVSDVMKLVELYISSAADGTIGRLEVDTPEELLRLRRVSDATGTVTRIALLGSDLLMLHPTPAAADVITGYWVAKPSEMTADANDPGDATYGGIPSEYHKALELYALAEAADQDDDTSSQMGDRYRQRYEAQIIVARHRLNTKLVRPSRIRVPGHRGDRWTLRPDQVGA